MNGQQYSHDDIEEDRAVSYIDTTMNQTDIMTSQ